MLNKADANSRSTRAINLIHLSGLSHLPQKGGKCEKEEEDEWILHHNKTLYLVLWSLRSVSHQKCFSEGLTSAEIFGMKNSLGEKGQNWEVPHKVTFDPALQISKQSSLLSLDIFVYFCLWLTAGQMDYLPFSCKWVNKALVCDTCASLLSTLGTSGVCSGLSLVHRNKF